MVLMMVLPFSLAIILLISYVGILVSRMLTKKLISPIEEVAGKLDEDFINAPYIELYPFINKIRAQHEQVLTSAKKIQDFSANASHELKTPLTSISGYAQLIEGNELEASEIKHFSHEIERNANRMLNLIDDIIKLSKLDNDEISEEFAKLDLYVIVKEELKELQPVADDRNIKLQLEGHSTIINGNSNLIRELFVNIVQNALLYNNVEGKVWVRIYESEGHKILSVEDNGIGIPKEELDRVFERFYRVDKSRSKAGGGTGLGLSIVKHIADIHDAEVQIESELGRGTKVTVSF